MVKRSGDGDLTTIEAARLLGYDVQTVRRMAREGRLPGTYRIGDHGPLRIPVEAIEATLQPVPENGTAEPTGLRARVRRALGVGGEDG